MAHTTIYDNGICALFNREHLAPLSADPTSWCNGTIRDCVALYCANHAIGSYGAAGMNIVNPISVGCGNNTGTAVSGPAGGINFEHDGVNVTFDYHNTVINPRVYRSYGFALRSNCVGTRVIGGHLVGTKLPTAYAAHSSYSLWGSAIFAQGAGEITLIGTDIDGSERYGIRMAVAGGLYPSVHIRGGKYAGCQKRVIFGQGIAALTMSPETLIKGNGNAADTTPGDQYCIDLSNSADNTDGGMIQIAGRFEDNAGGILKHSRIGAVDCTKGISGRAIGTAWSSAFFPIYCPDSVQSVSLANIVLDGSNGKLARLVRIELAVRAYVNRSSIVGEITSTTRPPVDIAIVSNTYRGDPPENVIYPSVGASWSPDPSLGHPIVTPLAQDTTVAAPPSTLTLLPIEGQRMRFLFIQDATGGRKLTWSGVWRASTLTAPGAANQRALVEYQYVGAQWVQRSSSGWY